MADEGFGQLDPSDSVGQTNPQLFLILQQLAKISTLKVVIVKAVDTTAKTVDVQPMVNMLDGDGRSTAHGTISGIPYWAWQFGKNKIEADPVVDDIGVMVCADRDISAVIATKKVSNPGSLRKLDNQDGIYFGGILNGDPDQWIKFTSTGLELADKNENRLVSGPGGWVFTGVVTMNGNLQLAGAIVDDSGGTYTGNITTSGDVVASGKSLKDHTHTYLRPSSGATTPTQTAAPT